MNFDTDKLIIVCFPQWAGGKFLINSLGISQGAVLQDDELARLDLNQELTSDDKFQILKNRLSKSGYKDWRDLYLGCSQLFGFNETMITTEKIPTTIISKAATNLSNSHKYFFIVSHCPEKFKLMTKIWKNAKVIVFKNSYNFICQRRSTLSVHEEWEKIKGNNWPESGPVTSSELQQYPTYIQEEIKNKFSDFYKRLIDYVEMQNYDEHAYMWDNNNYFSMETTLSEIKKLYDWLGLSDFDFDLVGQYYQLWINKLGEIKTHHEKTITYHHWAPGVR
jgi:hypothetical protein